MLSSFQKREAVREAISRFGRAFIHDLNNPYGGMSGYLELLTDAVHAARQQGVPMDTEATAELVEGLSACLSRAGDMLDRGRSAVRPILPAGVRFSPDDLREALLDLSVHGQINIPLTRAEGLHSTDPVLCGNIDAIAKAIRAMAEGAASFSRVLMGEMIAETAESTPLDPAIVDQLPPTLAAGPCLCIQSVLFRARLEPADLDRLYYPVNLRRGEETPSCGWDFAIGYNVLRGHGGGAAVQNGRMGLEILVFLPVHQAS